MATFLSLDDRSAASPTSSPACCHTPDAALDVPEAEAIAAVLKALADPVRLRLYSRIAASAAPVCVCDIQDVGVSQPTVSHHLRKLRDAGLVEAERRGTWVYYTSTPAGSAAAAALANVTSAPTS